MPPLSVQTLLRQSQLHSRTTIRTLAPLSITRKLHFDSSARKMAEKPTAAGEAISEVAQEEGGTSKGSTSAQMQSQITRARNFEQAATEVGAKIEVEPENVTSDVSRPSYKMETEPGCEVLRLIPVTGCCIRQIA